MFYFIGGVLLTVAIFIIFRAFGMYKVNTFQAIVVNYLVCVITGLTFMGDFSPLQSIPFEAPWVRIGLVIGVIFITTFYMMAITTQRVSVAAASMATKLSLVLPVVFSLWFLKLENLRPMSALNYLGLILVIFAVIASSMKKKSAKEDNEHGKWFLLLPIFVFLLSGVIDILFNYVNARLIPPSKTAVFSVFVFFSAATVGTCILLYKILFKGEKLNFRSLLGGLLLGIPNYFSIYLLLKSLTFFNNNGAVMYPLFNMSVIVLSAILGVILFRERLSTLNKWGVVLAVLSILLISYQDILSW